MRLDRAMEKAVVKSKSRRGSRGSYEFLSVIMVKLDKNTFNNHFYECCKF